MALSNEQLQPLIDEDPAVRAQGCLSLAELGDPAAIPYLAEVYQTDADSGVRGAAAAALQHFARQIPGQGGGFLSSRLPRYLSLLLLLSLLILLGLNLVLRLGDEPEAEPLPDNEPSDRSELLAEYRELLENTKEDAAAMREEWGTRGAGQLNCEADLHRVQSRPMRPIDAAVMPDFTFVPPLDLAIFSLNAQVIRLWDLACSDGTRGTVQQAIDASEALLSVENNLTIVETQLLQAESNPVATLDPASVTLAPEE